MSNHEHKDSIMQANFNEQGFLHVKGLLSADEVAHYKQLMQAVSGLNDVNFDFKNATKRGFSEADGVVKHEAFWPLIYHQRLVDTLATILPETPRFLQHSDIHVHHGAVGWHRDNAHRQFKKGPDWDETQCPYAVLRIAVYLQSYDESQFKMGVIPGSHRRETWLNHWELKLGAIYRRLTGQLPPWHLSLKPQWLNMEAGDALIFDQRVLHTGTTIKGPKYSIYLGYGIDNEHSRRHSEYFYNRKDLNYGRLPAKLATMLEQASLLPSFFASDGSC